jgi:hypothetical protein
MHFLAKRYVFSRAMIGDFLEEGIETNVASQLANFSSFFTSIVYDAGQVQSEF